MKASSVQERLSQMQRDQTQARRVSVPKKQEETDLSEIVLKMKEAQHEQRTSLNDGYVRMTVYVRDDIMAGMKSLCPRQGQLKQRVNEALEEYIVKKAREMGVE